MWEKGDRTRRTKTAASDVTGSLARRAGGLSLPFAETPAPFAMSLWLCLCGVQIQRETQNRGWLGSLPTWGLAAAWEGRGLSGGTSVGVADTWGGQVPATWFGPVSPSSVPMQGP